MNDASEHLAPVSYLPWATPVESVPERSAPPADEVPSAEGADADDQPRRAEATRAGRSRFGDPSDASRRRAERRRSRFAIVADDPDETGPERDARIDRLVVSRLRRSALSVAEVRSVLAEHGLDEGEIEEWIERSSEPLLAADYEDWLGADLLRRENGRVRFTERGFLLSNEVLCRFV